MGGLVGWSAAAGQVALRHLHVADLVVRTDRSRCQPALPGSACGQTLGDLERGLVAGQRRRPGRPAPRCTSPILLCDTDRSRCQPALPGSACGQTLGDVERGLVAGQRRRPDRPAPAARRRSCRARPTGRAASRRCPGPPAARRSESRARPGSWSAPPPGRPAPAARRRSCSCDTDRSRCQPALPGSGGGQTLKDSVGGPIARQRRREIALCLLHVADPPTVPIEIPKHHQRRLPAVIPDENSVPRFQGHPY